MSAKNFKSMIMTGMIVAGSMVSPVSSQTYDYSHRKSKCTIKAQAGANVKATLIRNHFGFGGTIRRWGFDTLQAGISGVTQNYGDVFLQYFDYSTPENEMKWAYVQGDSVYTAPDFKKADYLIEFCRKHDIKVRGHNLFWNEKKDWIPKWTWNLSTADFKAAMRERVDSAMTHFNGKVVQWDIINEIIHAENGQITTTAMLETSSGDPNIFSWILTEARKLDKTSTFVINDYNMESSDPTIDAYINKCKPLSDKFDIIGVEGHFGSVNFTRSDLDTRINKLSTQLNKKVWLTEVDWSFNISQSAAKVEEFMRTCFANKNVEGIVMWVWCKRKMWREMTSYFVDSLLVETAAGKKWRDVRSEWKTETSGTADANGVFSFSGYQGKYRAVVNGDTQYIYLHPKDSTEVLKKPVNTIGASPAQGAMQSGSITIPGRTVILPTLLPWSKVVFLSAYSVSGKLLSKIPLAPKNGSMVIDKMPSGCSIFRIHSEEKTYYSGLSVQLH